MMLAMEPYPCPRTFTYLDEEQYYYEGYYGNEYRHDYRHETPDYEESYYQWGEVSRVGHN